eukprot:3934140-Rhodomonas_salina.1
METSTLGAAKSMAAANMLTEIVFPNRRGVEISISCGRLSQPLYSRMFLWSRANCPALSFFQNTRVQERMNWSWNCFWWKERRHPCRSSASSPLRHRAMRVQPLHASACFSERYCRSSAGVSDRDVVTRARRSSQSAA